MQILISNSHADTLGGGLLVGKAGIHQSEHGVLIVRGCTASNGGGIVTQGIFLGFGQLHMQDCVAAEGSGGCLQSENFLFLSKATFENCHADQSAAAVLAHSSSNSLGWNRIKNVTFRKCSSGASRAIAVFDHVRLRNVTLLDNETSGSNNSGRQELVFMFGAAVTQLTCHMNCAIQMDYNSDVATLRRNSFANNTFMETKSPTVHALTCPPGYAHQRDARSVACERCPVGHMQMEQVNATCQACPPEAEICEANRMKLPRGMMVSPSHLSQAWQCPNRLACPGGILETLPGKLEENSPLVLQTMCQRGYTALGCVSCVEAYGRLDNDPLSCTECSDSSWHTLGLFAFYILKDSWLLLAAAATAKADGSKSWSGMLMNQLMTFTLLANILVSALLQTTTASHFSGVVRTFMDSLDLFLNFVSPSAGGAGHFGVSIDCLLRQVDTSRNIGASQSIMTALPLLLMLIFGVVKAEPLLALIVGLNVFLPGCMAVFGMYLVAFRLAPPPHAVFGMYLVAFRLAPPPHADLEMPFMPESRSGRVTLAFCILSCFAVALAFWRIVTVTPKKEGTSRTSGTGTSGSPVPLHVVYLTQSFKPGFYSWEMERFVRKLCLALISTMIPVTFSPALKMELVSVVLIVSLSLHSHFRPHQVASWNHLEIGLLTLSQFFTGVTGTLLVSDVYWSKDGVTSFVSIVLIITSLTAICATLAGLLLWNLYHEGRGTSPTGSTTTLPDAAADEELPK